MDKIGSIDVDLVVDRLMTAEIQKKLAPLELSKKIQDNKISLLGQLQSLLTTFQNSFTALQTAFTTTPFEATSTNTAVMTVNNVTANSLAPGNYAISVDTLATVDQWQSAFYPDPDSTTVGTAETLTFTSNNDPSLTFSIDVVDTDTLDSIQSKITQATGNFGVSATVISSNAEDGTPQYNLLIQGAETGTINSFTISGDTAGEFNFVETAATNATFTFNNMYEVRSSNTIDDVVQGVSFNLLTEGDATLIITNNSQQQIQNATSAVNDMLTAYNNIINFIDVNQAENDNNMFTMGAVKQLLMATMAGSFANSGDIQTLGDMGIILSPYQQIKNPKPDPDNPDRKYVTYGQLQIDPTIFQAYNDTIFSHQMNNDLNNVSQFFMNGTTGVFAAVNSLIQNQLIGYQGSGIIADATQMAQNNARHLGDQIADEKVLLSQEKLDLKIKYAKLNALLSGFDQMGSFMDLQFKALDRFGKK